MLLTLRGLLLLLFWDFTPRITCSQNAQKDERYGSYTSWSQCFPQSIDPCQRKTDSSHCSLKTWLHCGLSFNHQFLASCSLPCPGHMQCCSFDKIPSKKKVLLFLGFAVNGSDNNPLYRTLVSKWSLRTSHTWALYQDTSVWRWSKPSQGS